MLSGLLILCVHEDLQAQTSRQFSHSPQARGKKGKTRKSNTAGTPAPYTYEVLYNFCSETNCADGNQLSAGLIRDAAGNLYGTTTAGGIDYGGTVFKIDPSGHETVIYWFCSMPNCVDGKAPVTGLVQDSSGNLFGTTSGGGANVSANGGFGGGTVFQLAPPAQPDGTWTETVLYNFCSAANCADGEDPRAGLIQDAAGVLYGTTVFGGVPIGQAGYGTVFQLSPPSQKGGAWTETVLYKFHPAQAFPDGELPYGGLIQDDAGNLYGTTMSSLSPNSLGPVGGTVYKLAPPPQPGGAWTESVLYFFCSVLNCADGGNPRGGLIQDSAGNLYGTALLGSTNTLVNGDLGAGAVFRLAPPTQPGDAWIETVLYGFCSVPNCLDGENPDGTLTQDDAGDLFGTTVGGGVNQLGTAFQLSPPAQPGGAWTETVLYGFCAPGNTNCSDGQQPQAGLLRDPAGNLYGTTWAGGSNGGGTVFRLALPTFNITGTPISLGAGATIGNTSTITLNPIGGFSGTVTLTAAITSSPNGAQDLPTLSFGASNTFNLTGSSPETATLIVSTTAPMYARLEHFPRTEMGSRARGMSLAFGLMLGIGMCIPMRSRSAQTRLGAVLFLMILASGLLSCAGTSGSGNSNSSISNSGTTPGTYVVTVTGTSGSTTAKGNVTLTVSATTEKL